MKQTTNSGGLMRSIRLVALLALLLTQLPAMAYDFSVGGIYYNKTGGNAVGVYGSSIDLKEAVIPETVEYEGTTYNVTSIVAMAFQHREYLTSVTIGNSVETISKYAFMQCSNLTSVTIGNSVKIIEQQAFYKCGNIEEVTIYSETPPAMEEDSFESYYWPILSVPQNAASRYLATIWSKFEKVRDSETDTPYQTREIGNLKYRLIPGKTKNLAVVIRGDYSGLTEVTIPERISVSENGDNTRYYVSAIGYKAFSSRGGLKTVTFKSNNEFKVIGDYAFAGTGISTFTIPETVEIIGDHSFDKCSALGSIAIPGRVQSIGNYAFSECTAFENITIPGSVKSIGEYAFCNTSALKTVVLNEGLETIGKSAFDQDNSINTSAIYIPSTVKSIGDNAFGRFRAQQVEISDFTAWLGIDFGNSSANPLSVSYKLYLNGEPVTDITIPDGTTEIKPYVFNGCRTLKSVTFNKELQSIGTFAFSGCRALNQVTFNEGLQSIGYSAFSSTQLSTITIPGSVTGIGVNAFTACSALNQVTLNEGLQSIGNGAFEYDTQLSTITIPGSVTGIGEGAFRGCKALNQVTLNEGLQSIGKRAFDSDTQLSTITIPGSVTDIGEEAFNNASSAVTFEYGAEPVKIGKNAFNKLSTLTLDRSADGMFNVANLETLVIGNSVTEIGYGMFNNATKLKTLTLGSSLKSIGDDAFSDCTALTEVIVPPSVETIGASAFGGNTGLSTIIIGHNVKSIDEDAFEDCPAQTVSITAQTPPAAYDNTFTDYTGKLYVQGTAAANAYHNANSCWNRFENLVMIEPTELKMEGDKAISGKPGDTFQLTAKLYPDNVTLPQIFWRSTNPDIATVTSDGKVTLRVDISDMMTEARGEGFEAESDGPNACRIIAESLYANGPVAEVTVTNGASGIDDVTSDGKAGNIDFNAPVEVYNLQGLMVADSIDNLAAGFYIVRQGRLVKKIAVK